MFEGPFLSHKHMLVPKVRDSGAISVFKGEVEQWPDARLLGSGHLQGQDTALPGGPQATAQLVSQVFLTSVSTVLSVGGPQ